MPAEAFAFYESTGDPFGRQQDWGHVGLGLGVGDGQVIHAWDRVRVDHYLEVARAVGPVRRAVQTIPWAASLDGYRQMQQDRCVTQTGRV